MLLEKLFFLKKTSPDVGWSNKAIRCNKVDLPEQEGPVNETSYPLLIFKLIFLRTIISLLAPTNFLEIFANLIISLLIF